MPVSSDSCPTEFRMLQVFLSAILQDLRGLRKPFCNQLASELASIRSQNADLLQNATSFYYGKYQIFS